MRNGRNNRIPSYRAARRRATQFGGVVSPSAVARSFVACLEEEGNAATAACALWLCVTVRIEVVDTTWHVGLSLHCHWGEVSDIENRPCPWNGDDNGGSECRHNAAARRSGGNNRYIIGEYSRK